jgi:rod shape-determining protein MreC
MQQLFVFLYKYRAFILFILLEVLCGWFIVQNNTYHSAAYFNSSNHYAARIMRFSNSARDYMNLGNVNEQLARENARLNYLYERLQQEKDAKAPKGYTIDSTISKRYKYIVAKVLNASTNRFTNFLTIDKGTADGIEPGMGVIAPEGVVGKVKACSEHFSTVISVLHLDMQVSSQIKRNSNIGTAKWKGYNAEEIDLLYVPRHVEVKKGDTIVTSSYNTIFPQGVMVGTIKETQLKGSETFHEIKVGLSTNFNRLSYVYVIENSTATEQDSLEQATTSLQTHE